MLEESLAGYDLRASILLENAWNNSQAGFLAQKKIKWRLLPATHQSIHLDKLKIVYPRLLHDHHALTPIFRPTVAIEFSVEQWLINTYSFPLKQNRRLRSDTEQERIISDIRYCGTCFETQVRDFGFAWFKRIWQLPYLPICTQNEVHLQSAKCNFCNWKLSTHRELKFLLFGYCPNCSKSVWRVNSYSAGKPIVELTR